MKTKHNDAEGKSLVVIACAGYADIMPTNWSRVFADRQIDDLVAYFLTLKSGQHNGSHESLEEDKELSNG